ncbi:MAG: hypothetical protein COA58_14630 [Bacteroidetes bacterium]|nr:MAG: hypothetical protein COA58_14630 [Bacteroidota bacterium]
MYTLTILISLLFSTGNQNLTPSALALNSNKFVQDSLYASILFDTTSITCDTLCEGDLTEFRYSFKNVGTVPLILVFVKSSCGCYVPRWSKEPVLPGDSAEIIGIYSSRGRPGNFAKSMTVKSNDPLKPLVMLMARGYAKPYETCKN